MISIQVVVVHFFRAAGICVSDLDLYFSSCRVDAHASLKNAKRIYFRLMPQLDGTAVWKKQRPALPASPDLSPAQLYAQLPVPALLFTIVHTVSEGDLAQYVCVALRAGGRG